MNTVEKFSEYFIALGDAGRWSFFTTQSLLFYILIFLTLYAIKSDSVSLSQKSRKARLLSSHILFSFVIGVFLILSRIPNIMQGTLNPDESHWIAIAKTLLVDPRFWLSVDGGTGGPLVPFSLFFLKIFGLPIDSGTLKIMSSLFMSSTVIFVYYFFRQIINEALARISILPFAVVVSLMSFYDLVAFNSEHLVLFLLALALVFVAKLYHQQSPIPHISIVTIGISLGLIPFAKLQGVPMGLLIGFITCSILINVKAYKVLWLLIISAILPTLVIIVTVWSYGGFEDFWTSYITGNLVYATRNPIQDHALGYSMSLFHYLIFVPPELRYFFNFAFAVNLFGLVLLFLAPKEVVKTNWKKVLFSILLSASSIYCMVAPNNRFDHYTVLFILPAAISIGIALNLVCDVLMGFYKNEYEFKLGPLVKLSFSILFIVLSSFINFHQLFSYSPWYLPKGQAHANGFLHHPELATTLNKFYSSGERMTVWGWASEIHEDTEYIMGTRYVNSAGIIEGGPLQLYFTSNYLADLSKNKPRVFVQAIGPNYFAYYDTMQFRIENYPLIDDYIKANYSMVKEVEGAKVFLRNNKNINTWIQHKVNFNPTWKANFNGYFDKTETENKLVIFSGWAVVGETPKNQKAYIALISNQDTLMVRASRYPRHDVVAAYDNWDWLESGYQGFIPIDSLKADEYDLGLFIKEGDSVLFNNLNSAYKVER